MSKSRVVPKGSYKSPLELKENSHVSQVPRIPLARENICSRGHRKAFFLNINFLSCLQSEPSPLLFPVTFGGL